VAAPNSTPTVQKSFASFLQKRRIFLSLSPLAAIYAKDGDRDLLRRKDQGGFVFLFHLGDFAKHAFEVGDGFFFIAGEVFEFHVVEQHDQRVADAADAGSKSRDKPSRASSPRP